MNSASLFSAFFLVHVIERDVTQTMQIACDQDLPNSAGRRATKCARSLFTVLQVSSLPLSFRSLFCCRPLLEIASGCRFFLHVLYSICITLIANEIITIHEALQSGTLPGQHQLLTSLTTRLSSCLVFARLALLLWISANSANSCCGRSCSRARLHDMSFLNWQHNLGPGSYRRRGCGRGRGRRRRTTS